jgi:hypothetical protein
MATNGNDYRSSRAVLKTFNGIRSRALSPDAHHPH